MNIENAALENRGLIERFYHAFQQRDGAAMAACYHANAHFRDPVSRAMSASPHTLAPNATLAELRAVLDRGLTAIIADDQGFHGLITRFDLLNHLRRTIR